MKESVRVIARALATSLLIWPMCVLGEMSPTSEVSGPLESAEVPDRGTFWFASENQPPLPFNIYSELDLPVYFLGTNGNQFLVDDRDYLAMRTLMRISGMSSMSIDLPPGAGGGNPDPGVTNLPPAYSYAEGSLWLELINVVNGLSYLAIHTPAEEYGLCVYDLFTTTNLSLNAEGLSLTNWAWISRTEPGQTNLQIGSISPSEAWFRLARTNDSDGDGLSDAFETMCSHSSPTNADGPVFTTQPLSQTIDSGDSVTFRVAAVGVPPLRYQWCDDQGPLAGETNLTLSLPHEFGSKRFVAWVTNGLGLATQSDYADLGVLSEETGFGMVRLIGPRQDYTFLEGKTYYIESRVELRGRTVLRSCVIKPDWWGTNCSLAVVGTLVNEAEDTRAPVFFTSVDDNTKGVPFIVSTREPLCNTNTVPYLDLSQAQVEGGRLSNLRFSYASAGIILPEGTNSTELWDCQFVSCGTAMRSHGTAGVSLHNVLIAQCGGAIDCAGPLGRFEGEQVTIEAPALWVGNTAPAQIRLTNSFVIGVIPSGPALVADHVLASNQGGLFRTNRHGRFYLPEGSPYRGAGTTNISPRVAEMLKHKTSQPPMDFPQGMNWKGEMTLGPVVPRFAGGAPDYGYQYEAVDYTIARVQLFGSVTILPGTSVGFRQERLGDTEDLTDYGFYLREGSTLSARGHAERPISFFNEQAAVEGPAMACWIMFTPSYVPGELKSDGVSSPPPHMDFRFCRFDAVEEQLIVASGLPSLEDWPFSLDSAMYWSLSDSAMRGGAIDINRPDAWIVGDEYEFGPASIEWFNNTFDNVRVVLLPSSFPSTTNAAWNVDMAFSARHNLFKEGASFFLAPVPASSGDWVMKDNLFDRVRFYQYDLPLDLGYNAYWPLKPAELNGSGLAQLLTHENQTGPGEQFFASAPLYQSGPLGAFYLPSGTVAWHNGSAAPSEAGLFHYTTRKDQVKEGDEPGTHNASIGPHYVACQSATNATPRDSDADGIADHVENRAGTGLVASDETDWQSQFTITGVFDPTNSVYDDIDLSGNGLVGRIKRALEMSQFAMENPLTLTLISTGDEPDIVTFEAPISYDTVTNSGNSLTLRMNGIEVSLGECRRAGNGNCLLAFNMDFDPTGRHFLSAVYRLGTEPDGHPVMTGGGPFFPFVSSNAVQFFENGSMFDDTSAYLDAKVFSSYAEYVIALYDPSTTPPTFLNAITNSTASGMIQEEWNLTLADGVTQYTGAEIQADFCVTAADLPNTSTNRQRRIVTRAIGSLSESGPNMDVAYFYTPTNSARSAAHEQGGTVWNAMQGVVDVLIKEASDYPVYDSYFNRYLPDTRGEYPGYITKRSRTTNDPATLPTILETLLPDMTNGLTKQLYVYGHGWNGLIGGAEPGVYLSALDVGNNLNNKFALKGGLIAHNPYRFVFLDGCATASGKDWRRAFGIFPIDAPIQAARNKTGAQAYIGWADEHAGWFNYSQNSQVTDDMAKGFGATLTQFYTLWMNNVPLRQCLDIACTPASGKAPFPVPENKNLKLTINSHNYSTTNLATSKIYLVGYPGLTVGGRDPSFDSDTKYAAPKNVE